MGLTSQFDILDGETYNLVVGFNSDGRKRV